jgi:hypothetical protein
MKRIEVRLSLAIVAPLLDVIKTLAQDLKSAPAVAPEALPHGDPELNESWTESLLQTQRDDLEVMMALFGEEFFSEGIVFFDAVNGEAIARACSAVRLRLRERFLAPLGDEALEVGDVDLDSLAEPVRKAFMCYLFLATIQELIIQHLDESIIES